MVLNAYHGLQFPFRCYAASQIYCAELVVPSVKLVGTCRITLSSLKVDCHSDKDPEVSTAKKKIL